MTRTDRRLYLAVLAAALALGGGRVAGAKDTSTDSASLEVSGLGLWQDREQRIALDRMLGQERGRTLDTNAVEDAAFLLMSALVEQGFAKPQIVTVLTSPEGKTATVIFDRSLEATLPRGFKAAQVVFRVKRGERYRFRQVRITGLHALPLDDAKDYFLGERVLIPASTARVYSEARLRRAVDGLQSELTRRGYADASVKVAHTAINAANGHVDVDIEVQEGPRWRVTALRAEDEHGTELTVPGIAGFVGQPWSEFWQQNVTGAIRSHFYREGHPDVKIRIRREPGPARHDTRDVTVIAQVDPGIEVKVGQVRFEGAQRTRSTVLERRVDARPGDLLNPAAMDQARFRLTRLGIFNSVDVHYEPSTGPVRDPVFRVTETQPTEVNLLLGYGSYEQVRGGVEVRQYDLFGRAHQTRLLLLQSIKSSRGEYDYTVPELFGETVDGTAKVFGLQRKEISFLRQEYGGSFVLGSRLKWLGANATLGYTYQALRSPDNTLATSSQDQKVAISASFDLNITRDRRDNPLQPRHGYRWFAQADFASRYFGGNVDYQRVEIGASYHTPWGSGHWLHFGLNHGVVTTFGGVSDANLPVNERFFPGGDNSIRGYREGEAAPIGADGRFVGAKSYLLANAEFEQALAAKWSGVLFFDALGVAARLADYPFDEKLYTVGVGVRYQTIIGPLRAEYGYNLNPRTQDPKGTLLFSVGFPF